MKKTIVLMLVLLTGCKVVEDTIIKTKTDIVDKSSNVTDTTKTKVSREVIKLDTTKTTSGEITIIKNIFTVGKDSAGNDIPILKSQEINTTKSSEDRKGISSTEKRDSSIVQGKDSTNTDLKIDSKSKIDSSKETSTEFGWWP